MFNIFYFFDLIVNASAGGSKDALPSSTGKCIRCNSILVKQLRTKPDEISKVSPKFEDEIKELTVEWIFVCSNNNCPGSVRSGTFLTSEEDSKDKGGPKKSTKDYDESDEDKETDRLKQSEDTIFEMDD